MFHPDTIIVDGWVKPIICNCQSAFNVFDYSVSLLLCIKLLCMIESFYSLLDFACGSYLWYFALVLQPRRSGTVGFPGHLGPKSALQTTSQLKMNCREKSGR